jgi:hypothetical protein
VLKVARKKIGLQFEGWEEYISKLDELGGSTVVKKGVEEALIESKKHVNPLIEKSMVKGKLPAGGKYSQGETRDQIIVDPQTVWHGSLGEIDLGFDKTKPGAGGFLITGTPKMRPNYALEDIFSRKKYLAKITKQIREELQDAIDEYMGG